jgi:hypothetical protein
MQSCWLILPPQPPKGWAYRCAQLHPALPVLEAVQFSSIKKGEESFQLLIIIQGKILLHLHLELSMYVNIPMTFYIDHKWKKISILQREEMIKLEDKFK